MELGTNFWKLWNKLGKNCEGIGNEKNKKEFTKDTEKETKNGMGRNWVKKTVLNGY